LEQSICVFSAVYLRDGHDWLIELRKPEAKAAS
jgi:hypothetical protein